MAKWLLMKKFCEDYGFTDKAVHAKISRGEWEFGKIYANDGGKKGGKYIINEEGYNEWQSEMVLKQVLNQR